MVGTHSVYALRAAPDCFAHPTDCHLRRHRTNKFGEANQRVDPARHRLVAGIDEALVRRLVGSYHLPLTKRQLNQLLMVNALLSVMVYFLDCSGRVGIGSLRKPERP